MAEKKICSVCGNKAEGFNTFATEFGRDTILCEKCYSRVKGLKKLVKYNSKEEIIKNKEEVNGELKKLNYPQNVVNDINEFFDSQYIVFTSKEEDRADNQKQEQVMKDYMNGKYIADIKKYMLTSGFNFEGYRITEYYGVVTGEVVLGTGFISAFTSDWADFFGMESNQYAQKLQKAREAAQERAIMKSIILGGNALIGVDIDYINFSQDKIGVVYNGTSVRIEKID